MKLSWLVCLLYLLAAIGFPYSADDLGGSRRPAGQISMN